MFAALAGRAGRNVFLIAVVLFFGVPLLWLLLAPSKTRDTLASAPPLSFGTFEKIGAAWAHLFSYTDGIVGTWIFNSVFYSVTSVVFALAACIPAGYGLAKFAFRGRRLVLFLTLITMVVPQAALILPLYLEMSSFGSAARIGDILTCPVVWLPKIV